MIDFDLIKYPNIIKSSLKEVEIIEAEDDFYQLLIDKDDWMSHYVPTHSSTKEMYASYELSYGDVLTSGLGFGIVPFLVASKDNVNSITVIENNKSVIDLFNKNNKNISEKIIVVHDDINEYKTKKHFDFIYLDHYEKQQFEYQIENMKKIYKNIPNHETFYAWRMEMLYLYKMHNSVFVSHLIENKWNEFKEYVGIPTIPNLSNEQIKDFCCLSLFKQFYSEFKEGKNLPDDESNSL